MHAAAFLKNPAKHDVGPMVVLSGSERFLKHSALQAIVRTVQGGDADEEADLRRFAGKEADAATVLDELRTVSMWGGERIVLIEEADEFVSRHRAALETYLAQPAKKSALLLDVKTWRKNTRLAKALQTSGLDLECNPLKGNALIRWLTARCRSEHGKTLVREAALLLVELAGLDLGLLDQELAKLAAFVGERPEIEPADVRKLVGGWKAETTWAMTDAVRDGKLGKAFEYLDKLLLAGEAPQRIMGGISYVFRKPAKATELARQGTPLKVALQQAGVFSNQTDQWSRYLRRITRPRAEQLYTWLLQTDGGLKGGSRLPERVQLEQLLLRLSGRTEV